MSTTTPSSLSAKSGSGGALSRVQGSSYLMGQVGFASIEFAGDDPFRKTATRKGLWSTPAARLGNSMNSICRKVPSSSIYLPETRVTRLITANFAQLPIASRFICDLMIHNHHLSTTKKDIK